MSRKRKGNTINGKLRNEYFLDPGWPWSLLAWNAKECKGMANARNIARIERTPGATRLFRSAWPGAFLARNGKERTEMERSWNKIEQPFKEMERRGIGMTLKGMERTWKNGEDM